MQPQGACEPGPRRIEKVSLRPFIVTLGVHTVGKAALCSGHPGRECEGHRCVRVLSVSYDFSQETCSPDKCGVLDPT